MYYAGDGLDRSSVNSTLWICRSARQKKTLERRITSATCAPPTATDGAGLMFWMRPCDHVDRFLVVNTWLSRLLCGHVPLLTCDTRLDRAAWEQRHCGLQGALPTAPSFNVFVLYCTHQVPVSHHPFA